MLRRVLILACVTAFMPTLPAADIPGTVGMRVSPGAALIQGAVPGGQFELPLLIANDDDQPHVVAVSAVLPSEQGMIPPPGYEAIPSLSWLSFSQGELTVSARESATVTVTVSIPADERYYNQHWSFAVAIRSKPSGGQMLSLALYPRFEIETAPSTVTSSGWAFWKRTKKPAGVLAITPALRVVEPDVLGGPAIPVRLIVWNNSGKTWQGDVALVTGEEAAKSARLALSSGWRWLADPSCVRLDKTALKIKAHSYAEVQLAVCVSDKPENRNRAWEAVILAQSEDGPAAFARIRIKTPSVVDAPGKANEDQRK